MNNPNNPTEQPNQTEDQDERFRRLIREEVNSFLPQQINSAYSSREKRLKEWFSEQLQTFKPPEQEGQATSPQAGALPPEIAQRFAQMENEIKASRKKVEEAEQRAQDALNSKRNEEANARLQEALRAAGVNPTMMRGALGLHKDAIARNEKDELVMKVNGEYGEELVPFDVALKKWVSTEEGKSYLPPVATKGSGMQSTQGAQIRPGQKLSQADAMAALGEQLMKIR